MLERSPWLILLRAAVLLLSLALPQFAAAHDGAHSEPSPAPAAAAAHDDESANRDSVQQSAQRSHCPSGGNCCCSRVSLPAPGRHDAAAPSWALLPFPPEGGTTRRTSTYVAPSGAFLRLRASGPRAPPPPLP